MAWKIYLKQPKCFRFWGTKSPDTILGLTPEPHWGTSVSSFPRLPLPPLFSRSAYGPAPTQAGVQKTQNCLFRSVLLSTVVCYKVSFLMWNLSATKLYVIYLLIYPCKNNCWRTSPSTWKFGWKRPTAFTNAHFQSVFFGNASAVTPTEKVKLTRIESPLWLSSEPKMKSVRCPYVSEGVHSPYILRYLAT